MSLSVNLYKDVYDNFGHEVLARVRAEAFGDDIGQNSWLTVEEFREFVALLELSHEARVLDIGCGAGGPALFLARELGCQVTGIDQSESGIHDARKRAAKEGLKVDFSVADANSPLHYKPGTYDAVISIDAINHFKDRLAGFREFHRILKPAGRLLFTDAITVTGILSSEEIAARSKIGAMSFTPLGENERLLRVAGFDVLKVGDVTANTALISRRRHDVRQKYRDELIQIEGEDVFAAMQQFLSIAHRLSSERRLSRFVFLGIKL